MRAAGSYLWREGGKERMVHKVRYMSARVCKWQREREREISLFGTKLSETREEKSKRRT